MMDALSQFHFIRPFWLLALPVMLFVWWLLQSLKSNHWEHYIPKEMLDVLRVDGSQRSRHSQRPQSAQHSQRPQSAQRPQHFQRPRWRLLSRIWGSWGKWLLLFAWCLAIFAVAGPTWNKTPVPAVKNQQATVILLDLSRSMMVEDIKPNRLSRAKFKLIDILKQQGDGQTALIAYAGDAYVVSPLSNDPKTIEALLPALHPSIMPSQGSNIEAAIALALELLSNAQVSSGNILLLTDGVAEEALTAVPKLLKAPHKLSILAIGSSEPSPIPLEKGGFLRGANSEIVLAAVNQAELQQLANSLRGRYANLSINDSDVDYLLQDSLLKNGFEARSNGSKAETDDATNDSTDDSKTYDQWADMGHWFALLLIPLAVLCFRKGVIFGLAYVLPYLVPLAFLYPAPEAQAQVQTEAPAQTETQPPIQIDTKTLSYWDKLWQNKNQQGSALVEQEKYSEAADTFKRSDWAGTAHYRAGNYGAAINELSKNDDVTSLYNLGNAQAFAGEIETAIQTYAQVLQLAPKHEDAAHNKKVLEQLQDNKNQNKQDKQQSGQDQNQNQNQQSDSNSQDNSASDSQESSDQNSSQNQQENSENNQQANQQTSQQANQNAGDNDQSEQQSSQDPSSEQPPESNSQTKPDQAQGSNSNKEEEKQNEASATTKQEDANNTDDESDTQKAQAKQQAKQQVKQPSEDPENSTDNSSDTFEATPTKLKNASEQWLRSIKDNPSGLLQRKFEYQKQVRARQESLNQRRLLQSQQSQLSQKRLQSERY